MRMRIGKAISGLALVAAAGCSGSDTTTGGPPKNEKDLIIKSVNPSTVFIEGDDLVTVLTENGCGKDKVSIKVGDIVLPSAKIEAKETYHLLDALRYALCAEAQGDQPAEPIGLHWG